MPPRAALNIGPRQVGAATVECARGIGRRAVTYGVGRTAARWPSTQARGTMGQAMQTIVPTVMRSRGASAAEAEAFLQAIALLGPGVVRVERSACSAWTSSRCSRT